MDQVAEQLAELRERRALTLRELAQMSGVAADNINQIELGHRKARPSTLRKLARALEIDVQEFYAEPALPKAEASRAAGRTRRLPEWASLPDVDTLNRTISELSDDDLDDLARTVALTSSDRVLGFEDLPLPREESAARIKNVARVFAVNDEYLLNRDTEPPKEFRLAFTQLLNALPTLADTESHRHQNRGAKEAG